MSRFCPEFGRNLAVVLEVGSEGAAPSWGAPGLGRLCPAGWSPLSAVAAASFGVPSRVPC